MLERAEYEQQRIHPGIKPAMYQEWYDLLFVHFSVGAGALQALLPAGLTVDTFADTNGVERAWLGVVPFGMRRIRPRGLPALPWISAFLETNVRTYVHREGKDPGVWFFSLDAARWLACAIARATYHLPYHHATMHLDREGKQVKYRMGRNGHGPGLIADYEIGEPLQATPGSFEFWLVERYRLYSSRPRGLMTGLVHHDPYPVYAAKLKCWQTELPKAAGLSVAEPEHVCYSPGVQVEVFALEPCR